MHYAFPRHVLPDRIPPEELEARVKEYVEGNDALRDELIERHLRWCTAIASSFASGYPSYADDLLSEALLEMTAAIDRFPEKHQNYDIQRYVAFCIRRRLMDVCRELTKTIRVAARTQRYKEVDAPEQELSISIDNLGPKELQRILSKPLHFPLELRELLELCAEDERDSQILHLAISGYIDEEAADILGMARSTLTKRRNLIFDRFTRIWNDHYDELK